MAKAPVKHRNITEFTLTNTAFDGYRVQVMRRRITFRQYIPRKAFGKNALNVAVRCKEALLAELDNKRSWTVTAGDAKPVYSLTNAATKRLVALGFVIK